MNKQVNKGPDMESIRDDVQNNLWKAMWKTVGTHGPAPRFGKETTPEEFSLVYDTLDQVDR